MHDNSGSASTCRRSSKRFQSHILRTIMTTFLEIAKPVYRFLRLFGFITYNIDANNTSGRSYLKPSNKQVIIALTFQFVIIVLAIFDRWNLVSSLQLPSILERFFLVLYNILDIVECVNNTIIAGVQNYKLLNLLNQITDIEHTLRDINVSMTYSKTRCTLRCTLSIYVGTTIIFVYMIGQEITLIHKSNWRIIFDTFLNYVFLCEHICLVKYITLVTILKSVLQQMNMAMTKLYCNNKNVIKAAWHNANRLKQMTTMYQELFQCVRECNSLISVPILLHFASIAALLIIHMFNLCSMLILLQFRDLENNYIIFTLKILCTSIILCILILLCYAVLSELFTKEVTFKYHFLCM